MNPEANLGRSLFGYKRSSVDALLMERTALLVNAERRAMAAEAELAAKDAELADRDTQIGSLTTSAGQLQAEMATLRALLQETEAKREQAEHDASQSLTPAFLAEELSTLLASAEESARRIIQRARNSTESQIVEADRMWKEVQAQMARFAAWREQFEPAAAEAGARLEDVRQRIEEVPDLIRNALLPLADSVSSLDRDLRSVIAAATPPLLVTPSGLARNPVVEIPESDEPAIVEIPEARAEGGSPGEPADPRSRSPWPPTGDPGLGAGAVPSTRPRHTGTPAADLGDPVPRPQRLLGASRTRRCCGLRRPLLHSGPVPAAVATAPLGLTLSDLVGPALLLLAVLVAGGLFANRARPLYRLVRLGQPVRRTEDVPAASSPRSPWSSVSASCSSGWPGDHARPHLLGLPRAPHHHRRGDRRGVRRGVRDPLDRGLRVARPRPGRLRRAGRGGDRHGPVLPARCSAPSASRGATSRRRTSSSS